MTLPDMPDPDRSICLMVCKACPNSGRELWLGRLKSNGQIGTAQVTYPYDDHRRFDSMTEKRVEQVLRVLGGNQIIHFDLENPIGLLDRLMHTTGKLPVDNPAFDVAPMARRIIAGDSRAPLTLPDIFKHCGAVLAVGSLSEETAPAQARRLAEIYTRLIAPGLIDGISLGTRRKHRTREVSKVTLSFHGLPLPCPLVPRITPPSGGWRTDSWDPLEAQDVALRYADGADLEGLSELTSRSPRAIVARLTRDGILQHS